MKSITALQRQIKSRAALRQVTLKLAALRVTRQLGCQESRKRV
jgi:hypothetical protein